METQSISEIIIDGGAVVALAGLLYYQMKHNSLERKDTQEVFMSHLSNSNEQTMNMVKGNQELVISNTKAMNTLKNTVQENTTFIKELLSAAKSNHKV